MNFKTVFLFLSFFIRLIQCDKFLIQFIRDYFADVHIHQLVIFACWSSSDIFNFMKNIMQLDTVVSYNSIQDNLNLEMILKVNYYHIGVILDYDCPKNDYILEQFSRQLVFNESYSWLLLTNASSPPTSSLRDLSLTIESEMVVAIRKFEIFELYDIYNPSYRHGGRINVTYKGRWTLETGLENQLTQYKYVRRQNFNHLLLNVSVVLTTQPKPDFETFMTQPIYTELDSMSRFQHSLMLQLQDYYNFSMNLQRFSSWGQYVNGSWDGVLGSMVRRVTDISSSPFYLREERLAAGDYTVNVWNVHIGFLFRHPLKNDLQNGFLKPFTGDIWWVSIAIGVTYWIFLFFTVRIELYFEKSKIPDNTLMSLPASETGLITIAAISQQGLSDGPRVLGGRIVFLSLFLWALLLFQFYSASIVGALLSPPPRWITSEKALIESSLECGVEEVPYNRYFWTQTKNPEGVEIYKKKIEATKDIPGGSYVSADVGLKKVKRGGYAFNVAYAVAYKIIASTFTEDEICELQEVRIVKPYIRTYVVTAKRSPFKKLVSYGYRKIVEHGLAKRILPIWHHTKPQCPESYSSKPLPMSLKEFSPALFLLLMGVGFSLIILVIEYIYRIFFDIVNVEENKLDAELENSIEEENVIKEYIDNA